MIKEGFDCTVALQSYKLLSRPIRGSDDHWTYNDGPFSEKRRKNSVVNKYKRAKYIILRLNEVLVRLTSTHDGLINKDKFKGRKHSSHLIIL